MPRVLQAEYPLQGLQVLVGKVGEIEVETLIQKLIDANPNAQGQSRTTVSPEVQEKVLGIGEPPIYGVSLPLVNLMKVGFQYSLLNRKNLPVQFFRSIVR